MASVLKKCRHARADWEACGCAWYLRTRAGGRDTYVNVGTDRRAAERALARERAEPQETVGQAVDRYVEFRESLPDARANTLVNLRSRARIVKRTLGHVPVRSLTEQHLTGFVDALLATKRKPRTVSGIYGTLTGALRHARRRGVVRHLPLPPEGPGIPRVTSRPHELTLAQVEAVIGRMEGRWALVAELVLLTGLRWGEAVAIEPGDVTGHVLLVRRTRSRDGSVNAPKTSAGVRAVPLSPRAAQILEKLHPPVPGSYRTASRVLRDALGPLYVKGLAWHALRHAHATLLEAAGVTLRDQAARMGHGHRHAQTLQYGLASQAGAADVLDAIRQSSPPSREPA